MSEKPDQIKVLFDKLDAAAPGEFSFVPRGPDTYASRIDVKGCDALALRVEPGERGSMWHRSTDPNSVVIKQRWGGGVTKRYSSKDFIAKAVAFVRASIPEYKAYRAEMDIIEARDRENKSKKEALSKRLKKAGVIDDAGYLNIDNEGYYISVQSDGGKFDVHVTITAENAKKVIAAVRALQNAMEEKS